MRPSWPCALLGGAFATLLLSGCNSAQNRDMRAEFLETPSLGRSSMQRDSGIEANRNGAWPEDRWWREFHNADLDAAIEVALRDSPELKASTAKLNQAEALTRVEGARLLPFIDSSLEMTQLRVPNHGEFAAFNPRLAGVHATMGEINPFSIRYELDFWGKNRAALEASLGEAAAEEAEHAEVRLLLTTAVARTFIRAAALRQQVALAERMVGQRHALLDLAQKRAQFGVDNSDAIKYASIDLEAARKRRDATQALMILQQDTLARLMGGGPSVAENIFERKNVEAPHVIPLPASLPLELLAHRPDLAVAMHRAEAAAENIHVAKAEFLPSIDLASLIGIQAITETSHIGRLAKFLFRGSANKFEVVPGLHLPLFEGGRLRGHLELARSEYDQAVEVYNETLLKAVQQVADSISNSRQTRKVMKEQAELLKAEAGALALSRVRFQSGLNDRREALETSYRLTEQEFVLAGLKADHLSAFVDLVQALGGGYQNELTGARPEIDPEAALSGLETLSPAWVLEDLSSLVTDPPGRTQTGMHQTVH